jgi:hypothetical protein
VEYVRLWDFGYLLLILMLMLFFIAGDYFKAGPKNPSTPVARNDHNCCTTTLLKGIIGNTSPFSL